jgi:peptidoglycan/LPS O-acetylase OafA/YrhL
MQINLHKNNKFFSVNLLTSVLIILILYLHHTNYTISLNLLDIKPLNTYLVRLSVGGFIFLSAYKLTKSKYSETTSIFLRNRFLRIYPLYAIALILYTFSVYPATHTGQPPSSANLMVHFLLLQTVFIDWFGPLYQTLYFVSLLFLYYLLFILTRKTLPKKQLFYLLTLTIFVCGLIIHIISNKLGIKIFSNLFFIYYYFFISGMIYGFYENKIDSYYKKLNNLSRNFLLVLFFISSIIYMIILNFLNKNMLTYFEPEILCIPLILLVTIPLYISFLCLNIQAKDSKQCIVNIVNKIAYSSFCIFLFHRFIWTIMSFFWIDLTKKTFTHWLLIVPIGFIAIFLFSYKIQGIWDLIIKKQAKITIL